MDYPRLIEKVYEHLESNEVDKAVMTCLRLSSNLKDYYASIMFLRELYPDVCQLRQVFADVTSGLKEDVQKYLWDKTQKDWINGRSLNYSLSDNPDENVIALGVGELMSEIEQAEAAIKDMILPSGMGEYDLAAFTDRYNGAKSRYRLRITAINSIKERVKIRCLNYIIRLEKQLESQNKNSLFLLSVQNEVNNYFKDKSEDVYTKLQKVSQLVDMVDDEDNSLLLAQVRRTIKAVADYFYPPVDGTVKCCDGQERDLNDDRYLNRLQEFVSASFPKTSSKGLLSAELEHLVTVAKKLNEIASKGVHSEVTSVEAKQGIVCLYMFLFNLTSKLQYSE